MRGKLSPGGGTPTAQLVCQLYNPGNLQLLDHKTNSIIVSATICYFFTQPLICFLSSLFDIASTKRPIHFFEYV